MTRKNEKLIFRRENKESADFFCPERGNPGVAISQRCFNVLHRAAGVFLFLKEKK